MRKTESIAGTVALITAFLCGTITMAQAETLYQWKEADGSLTFSPSPPPQGSGIEYRVLNTGGTATADISLPENTLSASQVAQNNSAKAAATSAEHSTKIVQQQNLQQLNYATASKNALPLGISRPTLQASDDLETVASNDESNDNSAQQPQMMASRQKSSQCEDLGKRIVALENRMVISSNAEEMDQAVMQISRYQKSFNTHCGS